MGESKIREAVDQGYDNRYNYIIFLKIVIKQKNSCMGIEHDFLL